MLSVDDVFSPLDPGTLSTPSDSTSKPASGSSTSWLDSIGSFINSAGQLIQNGTSAVIGEANRIKALNATLEDTAKTATPAAPQIVTGLPANWPSWALPAIVAGVVIGGIFLVRKLR